MAGRHPCWIRGATNPGGRATRRQRRRSNRKDRSHSEALGGISRLTFQMNAASLPHAKLMQAIEAIGTRVVPAVRERLAGKSDISETSVMSRL